jgi:CheY-like chemotaxis protein
VRKTKVPSHTAPILLVEKSDQLTRAFKKTADGVPVVRVGDAEQTLRYLHGLLPYADRSKFPFPRFLLLDLCNPALDGLSLLSTIRQSTRFGTVPIIALTSPHAASARLASSLGANFCLTKPSVATEFPVFAQKVTDVWL